MLVIMAFLTALLISGNTKDEKVLDAFPNQTMNCNERTVLQCNISKSMKLNIVAIFWRKQSEEGFKCDPTSSNNPPGFECNYTREALTLTILHPTPANIDVYSCCIRADSTHGSEKINVSLGKCSGEFSPNMTGPGQMECSFNSVYPDGIINWFHYDRNVTSNSNITSLKNSDGTFNISSILNIQDKEERYNCSLWSIKNGRYLKDQEFEVEVGVGLGVGFSQGSRTSTQHCLSWTLLLLALMFSLRTCLSL
ncbi:uncharacterized protein LOC130087184 [Rhinichthys klamathensis goyatoka]|uniref:uncharacterized protein LOC130087184 n=1 Tax=Rhinichthys klamathensis goyatoka TaxID=3034132 RepID=UPI0024B55D2C|nr:uncharacterized protein LOC130087184 [Rhinichthys klamathensis goyatoka]